MFAVVLRTGVFIRPLQESLPDGGLCGKNRALGSGGEDKAERASGTTTCYSKFFVNFFIKGIVNH